MFHRYSFSGADCDVFAFYPGFASHMVMLESVHTVSFSVNERKGDVRALGHRSVKGFSKGSRTIAGSIILTVIEDHPLRPLMDKLATLSKLADDQEFKLFQDSLTGLSGVRDGWSIDRDTHATGSWYDRSNFFNMLEVALPPFNLLLHYVSEGANQTKLIEQVNPNEVRQTIRAAALLIEEIEIIDASLVTSVNDIVSEVVLTFKARDAKPFAANTINPVVAGALGQLGRENQNRAQAELAARLGRANNNGSNRFEQVANQPNASYAQDSELSEELIWDIQTASPVPQSVSLSPEQLYSFLNVPNSTRSR